MNIFDIFKKMNDDDIKNGTRNLAIANHLHAARKVKQGAIVEMGAAEEVLYQIMNDEIVCVLLVINRVEYKKLESA